MLPTTALEYLAKVPPNEPVFVLRAQDLYAPAVMASWAILVKSPLPNKPPSEESLAKSREAMNIVREFRQWQAANPDKVKIPD
jgi:hypothetical protein